MSELAESEPMSDADLRPRRCVVAAPGIKLTLEPEEDTDSWRVLLLDELAGAPDDAFAQAPPFELSPAEIVRSYPSLKRFVYETGYLTLTRLGASIVRPGDQTVDEEHARRVSTQMTRLREQLQRAFPDEDWSRVGIHRASFVERLRSRLRRLRPEDVLDGPPASCVPVTRFEGLSDEEADELLAAMEPPANWSCNQ